MAEAHTIVREPTERLKDFNDRLAALCLEEAWTSARLDIVDGNPVVTLMFEAEEATEEDVESGTADREGDPILVGPAVTTAVIRLRSDDHRSWEKTEQILEKIYDLAGDGVIEDMTKVVQAEHYVWAKHPTTEESVYLPTKVSYMIVVWERAEEDEDEEQEVDEVDEGEQSVDEDGQVIDAEATVIREPRPSRRKQRENVEEEEEGEDD